jgi:hypothetical protein
MSAEEESFRPPLADALRIENLPIKDLRRYQNNPRLHPKSQINKLAQTISEFGFLIPVLIDNQNKVLAGHARLEAADKLALSCVPCIRAGHLTETQKRTFIILDNRLAEEAKWDFQLLAKEIEFLQDEGIDLTTTGIEILEIEMILEVVTPNTGSSTTDDILPSLAPNNVITNLGDLWILGDHRLFCGDARRRESFETLLSGETAQLAFVDPPFNVKIRGHVSGKGRIKHREFAQASGEKASAQFMKFLEHHARLSLRHFAQRNTDWAWCRHHRSGRSAKAGRGAIGSAPEQRRTMV